MIPRYSLPEMAAVAGAYEILLFISGAAKKQKPLRIPGTFRSDVNDAVDGIRAPKGRARAPNHFDLLQVGQERLLHIPEHARKEWRIKIPTIHQDLHLVGG